MPTETDRFDPYKNFRFRVKWDGRYVAGVSKVSALKRSTEVVLHRDGSDPGPARKLPGETVFDAVTLDCGVTHDTAFEAWANAIPESGPSPIPGFRKNIRIEVYNEAGQIVLAYNLYGCWVSGYTALADLDAPRSAVRFESIRIEMEGWERDTAVIAPETEP